MNQLYDMGYQAIKDVDLLTQAIEKMNAVLVDIRYSPRSRDPNWNGAALAARLGGHYLHLKELGNEDYKGSTIRIADPDAGFAKLVEILDVQDRPAILMCTCWNRANCHRKTVARMFELKHGMASQWLIVGRLKELAGIVDPPTFQQNSLI